MLFRPDPRPYHYPCLCPCLPQSQSQHLPAPIYNMVLLHASWCHGQMGAFAEAFSSSNAQVQSFKHVPALSPPRPMLSVPAICSPLTHNYAHMDLCLYLRATSLLVHAIFSPPTHTSTNMHLHLYVPVLPIRFSSPLSVARLSTTSLVPLPALPICFPCLHSLARPSTPKQICTCASTCAANSLSVPTFRSPPTHNYASMYLCLYLRCQFAFRAYIP